MEHKFYHNEMYRIMKNRDSSYDGYFFMCNKLTQTYCLISCEATLPKTENVEFVQTYAEADAKGFQPCKLCNPNVFHVKWVDYVDTIEIEVPEEFDFTECLVFLKRSEEECLHKVVQNKLFKLLKFDQKFVLLEISSVNRKMIITFLKGIPTHWMRAQTAKYIWDMFDLDTELAPFYSSLKKDPIMGQLIKDYYGLRLIKINDLFEALCWSILGQQINLRFAYTLKKRFVQAYGEKFTYKDEDYWIFPKANHICEIPIEDLKEMQISTRKAEYIVGVAKKITDGTLNQKQLGFENNYNKMVDQLTSIRGVGKWTADYTIMKCYSINSAFPIADVGIHNALKAILALNQKPSIDEIKVLVKQWTGWESYAAFYLWRSLYD
ncbi:Ada metal-binding domain-containing protein [Chengkuizengella sediminis]|uniref:Ada metal-binding domain-containing protein n=1 Tax=Chengkuizengella sediminis TaxID=1885917 RepID=UPI0013895160|nr:Ada metal-binding domain-containing protein [Chengkuizengella sediminis]NDI36209.1 DNA-3-methyladenine glycosylase [Chengkuizengella sediminis]